MIVPPHLRQEIELCLDRQGVFLVELAGRGDRTGSVLEVYVDTEEGVGLELCAKISRLLRPILDASPHSREAKLVVSSPGLDRPLMHHWQYKKHVGRQIEVICRGPEGQVTTKGTLLSAPDQSIVLESVPEKKMLQIEFDRIDRARVIPRW